MSSLIFPYNRVFNNDMSIEAYHFIRSLPKELTTGFKVEAAFWFVEFIVLAFLVILYYFSEKSNVNRDSNKLESLFYFYFYFYFYFNVPYS